MAVAALLTLPPADRATCEFDFACDLSERTSLPCDKAQTSESWLHLTCQCQRLGSHSRLGRIQGNLYAITTCCYTESATGSWIHVSLPSQLGFRYRSPSSHRPSSVDSIASRSIFSIRWPQPPLRVRYTPASSHLHKRPSRPRACPIIKHDLGRPRLTSRSIHLNRQDDFASL